MAVYVHEPLQTVAPLGHWQEPFTQSANWAHVVPQVPQCDVLESRFASQPSPGVLLQLPKPAVHAPGTQVPLLHARVPLG